MKKLFIETLLPLAILILIGYFFIKTPTDLLTWNLVLFIIVGSAAMIIYLIILEKFTDFDFDDPFVGAWTRLPLQFSALLPITLIMVIGAFFLDEKYEVFGTKSSLLLIIITWGILLIIAAALIGGSFHISKRIYKFIKKKYSNK
jgi:hypothetical protein